MPFSRALVTNDGLMRPMRAGDGLVSDFAAATVSADANSTYTAAQLAGGLLIRTSLTAGRTDTTPTGAQLDAANPSMDIGDNFTVAISNRAASALTIAGGTGVTVAGLNAFTSATRWAVFTKTGVATYTCDLI